MVLDHAAGGAGWRSCPCARCSTAPPPNPSPPFSPAAPLPPASLGLRAGLEPEETPERAGGLQLQSPRRTPYCSCRLTRAQGYEKVTLYKLQADPAAKATRLRKEIERRRQQQKRDERSAPPSTLQKRSLPVASPPPRGLRTATASPCHAGKSERRVLTTRSMCAGCWRGRLRRACPQGRWRVELPGRRLRPGWSSTTFWRGVYTAREKSERFRTP